MMIHVHDGHDFISAVSILANWLLQYRRDMKRRTPSEHTDGQRNAEEQSATK
jgi:hypothetical protein